MKLICFLTLIIVHTFCFSQSKTPEQIVQENLDAYNQRDIKGFTSLLADTIKLYDLGAKYPTAEGIDKVKMLYQNLFINSPNLKSTLLNRIVIGNKVIDHESIVGRNGMKEVLELVVIYEIQQEKITKLTVIRQ